MIRDAFTFSSKKQVERDVGDVIQHQILTRDKVLNTSVVRLCSFAHFLQLHDGGSDHLIQICHSFLELCSQPKQLRSRLIHDLEFVLLGHLREILLHLFNGRFSTVISEQGDIRQFIAKQFLIVNWLSSILFFLVIFTCALGVFIKPEIFIIHHGGLLALQFQRGTFLILGNFFVIFQFELCRISRIERLLRLAPLGTHLLDAFLLFLVSELVNIVILLLSLLAFFLITIIVFVIVTTELQYFLLVTKLGAVRLHGLAVVVVLRRVVVKLQLGFLVRALGLLELALLVAQLRAAVARARCVSRLASHVASCSPRNAHSQYSTLLTG